MDFRIIEFRPLNLDIDAFLFCKNKVSNYEDNGKEN